MGTVAAPSVNVLCMDGESEEHGYAHNSLLQNFNFHTYAKPHLSQAIHHLLKRFIPHNFHDPQSVIYKHPQYIFSHDETTLTAQNDSEGLLPYGSLDFCASSQRGPEHDDQEPLSAPPAILHVDDTCTLTCCTWDQNTDVRRHHARYAARLVIVDFGCSHGPNTLDHAKFIVQELRHYLKSSMSLHTLHDANYHEPAPKPIIEIQYYFSDLPSNNFNSLVQSLDSFWDRQVLQDDDGRDAPFDMEIFDGVVAGSFHKRLFPTGSVHLGISIYGLHWLSQVPREVVNKASPAWNGGHIWLHGQRPAVVQAYARQFKEDLKSFLLSRAQEMASGGVLFLFFPGRAKKSQEGPYFAPNHDIYTGCYEDTWKEMVTEGLISEEELAMFNIPFFNSHLSETQEALEGFSTEFKVLKMEVLKDCKTVPKDVEKNLREDRKAFGEFWSRFVASLMNPMVEAYLGPSRARMLFERLKHQATLKAHLSTSMAYDMTLAIIQRI